MDMRKQFALMLVVMSAGLTSPVFAWDPIRDITGQRLDQHAQNLVNSADKFRRNPVDYTIKRTGRLLMDVCSAPERTYEASLHAQVRTWRSLPEKLIRAVQADYRQIDLRRVRYAQNITTGNGDATTFAYDIYFPESIDLWNADDLHWMLHELEHTAQYAGRSGGKSEFLCEYAAKLVGRGLDAESTDIERAAERKADYLIDRVYEQMHSQSSYALDGGSTMNRPNSEGRSYYQAAMPRVAISSICRAGPYWQVGPAGPVGSPCFMPGWGMRGAISFN